MRNLFWTDINGKAETLFRNGGGNIFTCVYIKIKNFDIEFTHIEMNLIRLLMTMFFLRRCEID